MQHHCGADLAEVGAVCKVCRKPLEYSLFHVLPLDISRRIGEYLKPEPQLRYTKQVDLDRDLGPDIDNINLNRLKFAIHRGHKVKWSLLVPVRTIRKMREKMTQGDRDYLLRDVQRFMAIGPCGPLEKNNECYETCFLGAEYFILMLKVDESYIYAHSSAEEERMIMSFKRRDYFHCFAKVVQELYALLTGPKIMVPIK